MTAWMVPGATVKDTPLRARIAPKRTLTRSRGPPGERAARAGVGEPGGRLVPVAEVEPLPLVGARELRGRPGERHPADVEDVGEVGDPERHRGVLLDQQDRGALPVDLPHDRADLRDDPWGEAERRLVE